MKTFTVVLGRSEEVHLALMDDEESSGFENDVRTNVYVAQGVVAKEPMEAVRKAKREARTADRKDLRQKMPQWRVPHQPQDDDYFNLVVFEGKLDVVLFGCVTGGQG